MALTVVINKLTVVINKLNRSAESVERPCCNASGQTASKGPVVMDDKAKLRCMMNFEEFYWSGERRIVVHVREW